MSVTSVPPVPPARICYVAVDANGNVISHGHMPSDAASAMTFMNVTQISETDFEALIASTKPYRLVEGQLVQQAPVETAPTPLPLATVRASALLAIDTAAEVARGQFLTPGSGQSMEYQQTQADAARALADPASLNSYDYPWLAAEQTALASIGQILSLLQVARLVQQQTNAWITAGAAIKATRRSAKLRVGVAIDAAEIATIMKQLTWPTAPAS